MFNMHYSQLRNIQSYNFIVQDNFAIYDKLRYRHVKNVVIFRFNLYPLWINSCTICYGLSWKDDSLKLM